MAKYVFGVDVGGTTVKLGLFDQEGTVLEKWEITTDTQDGGSKILPHVADSILGMMEKRNIGKEEVLGVGIGAPGPIDENGVVHKAVNLGWGVFNINESLGEILGLPVRAGNDANVAALGEMWKGGGKGFRNILLLTLGTGVGGGIIAGGQILTGAYGAAGEIGHIHVRDEEEEACGCGNKGCLEQYASATGVKRLAERILEKEDMPSSLRDKNITAKVVFDAVKEGDRLAIMAAEEFGECLGRNLAIAASILNPEAIVIGGGVSKAGGILFDFIKPSFGKYVFHGCADVTFTLATLENDAGIYGAAKLILNDKM